MVSRNTCLPRVRVAITVDLHEGDLSSDITFTAEWLNAIGVPATFFVPSAMLTDQRYADSLRELNTLGHEVGSHTHNHDGSEIDALLNENRVNLRFLTESKQIYEDFYGLSPRSFRSPGWCMLSSVALDELARLGYAVDSSATPQRLSFLSSHPFRGAWTLAPRRVRYIRPGLLEVPTSSFIVPAGSPTFLIIRRFLSLAFVRLLVHEALMLGDRVITLQFHPNDFNPNSTQAPPYGRLRWRDFWLNKYGGLTFKHRLKDVNQKQISQTTHAIIRLVKEYGCHTLACLSAAYRKKGV